MTNGTSLLFFAGLFCIPAGSPPAQTWDHEDLVRSMDQAFSVLAEPNLHVLAVLQEAQVDAFISGDHEASPINNAQRRDASQ